MVVDCPVRRFGLIYIADGFRSQGKVLHLFLTGAGFLLLAPQAFLRPAVFSRFKLRPSLEGPVDWMAAAGVLLLVAGLLLRWL